MPGRLEEWDRFSSLVRSHIEGYTITQYGDHPHDPASEYRPEDCIHNIQRYASRHFTGQRGTREKMRDLLKLAHYACLCFFKEEVNEKRDNVGKSV